MSITSFSPDTLNQVHGAPGTNASRSFEFACFMWITSVNYYNKQGNTSLLWSTSRLTLVKKIPSLIFDGYCFIHTK